MKACLLRTPSPVEANPLEYVDVPVPSPAAGELLVRGLVWALVIGAAGGLLPAIRAARLPVTVALRTG